jgi:uncharacterized protein DUF4242
MEYHSMKNYLIQREIPGIGNFSKEQLREAACVSNNALEQLNGNVVWEHSFVTHGGTWCSYRAESVAAIEEHARLSGFPATRIIEVIDIIGPQTARG